jgi:hypothetical protein
VPRFLSPEWVEEANELLSDPDLEGSDATDTATAGIRQVVTGSDHGEVRITIRLSGPTVRFSVGDEEPVDVTIAIGWDDAVALSRGDLAVAGALTDGRVRVRGDLTVLMKSQEVLAGAQPRLRPLSARTTY